MKRTHIQSSRSLGAYTLLLEDFTYAFSSFSAFLKRRANCVDVIYAGWRKRKGEREKKRERAEVQNSRKGRGRISLHHDGTVPKIAIYATAIAASYAGGRKGCCQSMDRGTYCNLSYPVTTDK